MARLAAAHVHEFQAVKGLCYRGLGSAELRERVGDRLTRHLGLSSYCFGANDPATALPVHSLSVGLDAEAMDAFFGLVLATPSLDFGPWVTAGRRVARLENLVDDVEHDPYMTDILRPSGLRHDVQVAFAAGGWSWGHACLRRRAKDPAFAGHELRFLAAIVPHVTAGLRAAARRVALESGAGTSTGVVVLGPDGRVELANGVAERLFRQPVSGTSHSFLSAINIVVARLERALDAPDGEAVPALTVIDEASREAYRLRAERLVGADGRDRGLVMIEPARSDTASDLRFALAQRGLTPRESEVARALLLGRTNIEIAGDLRLSPNTVHDHVRNVFDKLAVSSRQQLALQLLA